MYLTRLLTTTIILFLSATVLYEPVCLCAGETVGQSVSSQVVINEFMADNKATIQSPTSNYTDWIELYNPTVSTIELSGMFLTDNMTDLKWQFTTGTIIEPQRYLIIWADGNLRLGPLHTSFKLDKKGGALGLIADNGATIIDLVTYGKQLQDVSFGRTVDGGSNWNYLLKPTPGEANADIAAFLSGYPWQLWFLLPIALMVVGLVVFRDNLAKRRRQH